MTDTPSATAGAAENTLGPMREIATAGWNLVVDNLPRDLLWPTLLLTAAIATGIWLYLFERVLRPLWAGTLLVAVAPATERSIIATLDAAFGASPALEPGRSPQSGPVMARDA